MVVVSWGIYQLKVIGSVSESLGDFLIGEGKLENFLEDSPPIEANIHSAKLGLIEAKRYLHMVTNEAGIRVSKRVFFINVL